MRELKHDGLAVPGRVELAHEPDFTVGALRVSPSTRQVECGHLRETIEPRVMQVLVSLARANGQLVTRDELTEWCWGGRIVGEDAINRAISRVRHVASAIGRGTFTVETVPSVGYRLLGNEAHSTSRSKAAPASPDGAIVSRRVAITSAGVLAAGAVGLGIGWSKPWRHRPNPEAVELLRRGDLAQRASRPDQTRQATSYFEQAVRIDPQYAAAWGALALAYTHSLDGFSEAQFASLPGRIRSAAGRALLLDPDNADAKLALACVRPNFRNWSRAGAELRRIRDRYPDHWLANGRLAIFYYQVGRLSEGADLHRGVIARDPMIPGPYAFAATALSNLGRIQEADALLKDAADRWPANPFIWSASFNNLLFTGRAGSAVALLMDPEARPSGVTDREVQPYLALARALESRQPSQVQASIDDAQRFAESDIRAVPDAAPVFALFDRPDLTFASLERYFLNRGPFGAASPIGPFTRRYTDFLFSPAMASARADPRFDVITRAIGLAEYWRNTGIGRRVFPI
jgi:DNA-binding winged helix-turn-helix (wHTH) protein/tetratricopeptide (TPR) repeat protein